MNKCYLTGQTCDVVDVLVDGLTYQVSESMTEDMSLKQIREKIKEKVAHESATKSKIVSSLDDMMTTMGVSREQLIAILGGKVPADMSNVVVDSNPHMLLNDRPITTSLQRAPAQPATQIKASEKVENGFKKVDGSLTSKIRAEVNVDSDASNAGVAVVPGYSGVSDKNGKTVVESNKMVKTQGNTSIVRSDFGTTIIAINNNDVKSINDQISKTDGDGNLVRRGVSHAMSSTFKACPVCKGTGFTEINSSVCVKCKGSGNI